MTPCHEFSEFTKINSSYFFIFLINFFLISSFNIRLIENYLSYF